MSPAVLVVADDESVRQFVEHVLERGGFDVSSVADASAATERLAAAHYDAIVLDSSESMSVLRYLEAFDASLIPHTAVATSHPRDAAKVELREICRVIVKPFDAGRLLDAVGECTLAS